MDPRIYPQGQWKGGTPLIQAAMYSVTLTPTSVAAATAAEETFSVPGVQAGDMVFVVPPANTKATGIAGARVTQADQIGITFVNPTAGALVPDAGVFRIAVFRPRP